MPVSRLSLAVRLHRYGFLVSADLVAAGKLLGELTASRPADRHPCDAASRERELFRQFTGVLKRAVPEPRTNLCFAPMSPPISPASFAAALWGLSFIARATLVLVCVEGFSLAEAAFIVDMPLAQAEEFMVHGLIVLGPDHF